MSKLQSQVVTICFEEDIINNLFSELLRSRGVATRIVTSPNEISHSLKVITEPQFAPLIPDALQNECMVVGNKESLKTCRGVRLARPLTEQKIESAITEFLRA